MFSKTVTYLICLLFFAQAIKAQRVAADTTQPEGKLLEILYADRLNFITVDSLHRYTSLAGKVKVKQDKTFFYADSAILNEIDNSLEAFDNIHINDADSVHTYAQYLKYLGKEKRAYLNKKVKLTDGKGTLTTEELVYDVTLKIGTYVNGGKLVNKQTILTSTEGNYYGNTKDVLFRRNVRLVDPEYTIITDTLQYNTGTEIANFTSPTTLTDTSGRIIKTREGFFDRKNKKGMLFKRSVIDDSSYTFTADEMAFDDSTKLSEFRGNAVYRGKDTAEGFDMIANNIKTDRKKDILLATEKPILLIKQGKDSIFIAADTLYSARLADLIKTRRVPVIRDSTNALDSTKRQADSTTKYFEAYYNVKIFSDSLQARGDSLFYSLQDSVFRLFTNPVVWAQENQITGDTIYLYLKNKKPERLQVFENAMAISRVDSTQYYNQVKGNTINAFFVDGKINFLRAKGNAENVYYGQDELKKFIGVNKSSADLIDILFDDGKAKQVTFQRNLDGTMYPMRQVNHEEIRLRGYKWLNAIRPKSKYEILVN
ncbi:MAG: OstA-like protein [Sediminibacterium sp.]|nr:OstA-like protein [Sediminibacterium sp.]MDP3667547.1 OstA-like protein [Sediminibacterium sp.]